MSKKEHKVKPINKDRLPIKYVVRSYTMFEDYPSPLDILFDIASDDAIINGLEFDYAYARYVLSDKLSKQKYEDILRILVSKGFLEENYLGKKLVHKLINHPWE